MKYVKYRVVVGKYNINDLPNTTAVYGKIFNLNSNRHSNIASEANIHTIAMIKDIFDRRFETNICPGMGYDPLKYELDISSPSSPIIYYNPMHGSIMKRTPVFNVTWYEVICEFGNAANTIDYRAMRITKYQDKWYVQSKFGYPIIGIIDDKGSINEICAEADKIWETYDDSSSVTVTLTDN